jgi:hypothetical protein
MKKMILIVIFSFCSLLTFSQSYKTYHIKEGQHYCQEHKIALTSYKQEIYFKFTQSCLYDESQLPSTGWNKLWGSGQLSNHVNSERIGWRCWNNSKFIVGSYVYVNSQRIIVPMDTLDVMEEGHGWLTWEYGNYKVTINSLSTVTPQPNKPGFWIFQQYPYFGGESVAPHDMDILIKKMR